MVRRSAGKIWCGYFRYASADPAQRELVAKVCFEERGFTAIVRAEGARESVIRNRMKRIFTKLRNCGSVRCGAVAFVRVSALVSALAGCAGLCSLSLAAVRRNFR